MDLYGSSGQAEFRIDDLLDFSNDELFSSSTSSSSSSSSSAATSSVDHHPSLLLPSTTTPISTPHHSFVIADLCFPSDNDVAELEWVSHFVGDDNDNANDMSFFADASAGSQASPNDASFSARTARSKRSPRPAPPTSDSSWISGKSSPSPSPSRSKRSSVREESPAAARRCSHCLSEKTPQWRSGPMGPKTLCNACGVRFKSGRLVPEYRPAASPTFVLTQHSNSHRKVMELRRQKEVSHQQNQQQPDQPGQFYSAHHHHHGFRVC